MDPIWEDEAKKLDQNRPSFGLAGASGNETGPEGLPYLSGR